jgi:hypothetical protein
MQALQLAALVAIYAFALLHSATAACDQSVLALLRLLRLQDYSYPQMAVFYLLSYGSARQLRPPYAAFARAFNENSSTQATVLRLVMTFLTISCTWKLVEWLHVFAAACWFWRSVLWPVLLGQLWRPRWYITVRAAIQTEDTV